MSVATATTALGWYWSETAGEWQLARIPAEDRLIHLYVIGASGSGKTKFLEFLIRQDLAAGQGCAVIDPHGDLIEDLKGAVALLGRQRGEAFLREQVVLVDLADPRQTVAFNPIERLPGVSPGEQAAELISSFRKIWSDSWGVRMEDLLRNSLVALAEADQSLVVLPKFLTDARVRAAVLGHLTHPIASDYFQRFQQLSDRNRLTWAEPVLNKVNALLANDHVRHLLAAPKSTFNLREVMDSGKVLLVKLDKGRLNDAADLLGSLLLSKLQLAAFSRSDIPAWQRRPFYLYVDEFQNFASDSFGVLLSEARKYGLSLVLAHQTLAQIPEELSSVILGNVGLHVVFRVNRRDAEKMAKESFSYSGYNVKSADLRRVNYWSLGEEWEHYTAALQQLEPRHAYVKHKIEGGLIPIQTADVAPAWQEFGMTPVQYGQYLAGLPIGAAALRPRIPTAQPVSSPSTPTPAPASPGTSSTAATPDLTDEQHRFLALVLEHPELTISQLYQQFSSSTGKGAKLRDILVEAGYLIELETRLGRIGRAAKFLVPTPKAIDRIPTALPTGRGGPLHRHVQRLVVAEAKAKGYQAQVEYELANGGIVDVHIDRGRDAVAVEISITSDTADELGHLAACLDAGYGRIVCLVRNEAVREALERALGTDAMAGDRGRVIVADLSRIGALL